MTDSTDRTASERWLANLEGQQVPDADGNKVPYCDSCVSTIHPGDRATLYYANKSVHTDPPTTFGLMTMAMYCPDCHRPNLFLPHKGTHEVLLQATLDEDGRLWDFSVVDASSETSGLDWNPRIVMEDILGASIDLWFAHTHTPLAPGDVADLLFAIGMDPREIVDPDTGAITDDETTRQEAHELFVVHQLNAIESGRAEKVKRKGERQDEWMLEEVGLEDWDDEHVYFDADAGEWVIDRDTTPDTQDE